MVRTMVTILALLAPAANAAAAPPPLRPIDVPTIYALTEAARSVHSKKATPAAVGLRMRTIVIDPGHGGQNKGAIGVANVREKFLTLELAYELRDALEAKHPELRVVLTRYWDRDVGLDERTDWANAIGADLFVSLHYNAATHDQAVGFETYCLSDETMETLTEPGNRRNQQGSKVEKRAWRTVDRARVRAHEAARKTLTPPFERSKLLAEIVQKQLAAHLDSTDRGLKQANFAVLRGALMPAIVVESGFLTHPIEGRAVLTEAHRRSVIEALVAGIEAFDAASAPPRASAPVAASHLGVH